MLKQEYVVEMVPDLIWATDLIDPWEIWSLRNLVIFIYLNTTDLLEKFNF